MNVHKCDFENKFNDKTHFSSCIYYQFNSLLWPIK
jgi:hypothetical protein